MHASKLRILGELDLEPGEIAAANERITGWRPTDAAVSRRLNDLEIAPRVTADTRLVPRRVAVKHNSHRFRHMLDAESRRRRAKQEGREPSQGSDKVLISLLHDLLFGRGAFLVIGYDRVIGWHLVDMEETDTDIIRRPVTDSEVVAQ
jgi:hypothetical protein